MSFLNVLLVSLTFTVAKSEIFKAIQGCERDFKLPDNVTSTSVTSSDLQCVRECADSDVCQSVNVCPLVSDSNSLTLSCEKMDANSDWSCNDLETSPGCSFYKTAVTCYNGGRYRSSSGSCECVFGFTGDQCERHYYDCSEAYQKTLESRGWQNLIIQPLTSPQPFTVHCYLDWGGFTYISRKVHYCPQLNFNKSWEEMRTPFGDISCNHWLGLEHIHQLTTQADYVLDIYLETQSGWHGHPRYTEFRIGDEAGGYNFTYTQYEPHYAHVAEDGFGADGVNGPNGHPFATYDRPDPGNCVQIQGVSWWYGPACPDYNPHLPLYDGGSHPRYLMWPEGGVYLRPTTFDAQIYTTW